MNLLIISIFLIEIFHKTNAQTVTVRLYTQSNKITATEVTATINLSLLGGFCARTECTNYMIVHGFNSNGQVSWAIKMKDKLLETDVNSNVFIVDWREGANTGIDYQRAVYNLVPSVAEVYKILNNQKEYIQYDNFNLMNMYCIGHSLGSHFCGLTSKLLIANLNLKFKKISALDPAGPCFEGRAEDQRLSINDAAYVEAIHTSQILGYNPQIGHADFYVNGGTVQPGCFTVIDQIINSKIINNYTGANKIGTKANIRLCERNINLDDVTDTLEPSEGETTGQITRLDFSNIFLICSHGRAYQYFTETITKLSYACKYTAYQCSSYRNFLSLRCNECPSNDMGYNSVKPVEGSIKYYVRTNSFETFCNPVPPVLGFSDKSYCVGSGHKTKLNNAIIYLSIFIASFDFMGYSYF